MTFSFEDFEPLYATFRKFSEDPEAVYWADAVFHLLLPREASTERRFAGGIYLWLLWAIPRCFRPELTCRKVSWETSNAIWAYRILPTPAHLDTITPFFRDQPLHETIFYSALPADGSPVAHRETSLEAALNGTDPFDRLRALIHALRLTRRIKRLLSRAIPEGVDLLPSDFVPRIAELILHSALCLSALRKTDCHHTAIFLTYELMPDAKALINWARETGIRVIHVMHGQRLPTYQITNATDLILFSKIDEPWFRSRVAPGVKLWTIGHPRLERIYREIPRKIATERPQIPRIAFFSQPSEANYDRQTRQQDWMILAALKGRAEIRIRLHPRESREIALLDLESAGLDSSNLSDDGLQADLSWCDAVASSWSTVSMEAAACGRGIFWTCSTPERYEASAMLRDHGIGLLIREPGEWQAPLEDWAAGAWREPVMISESHLRDLGMIGDMDRPWLERLALVDPPA